MAIVRYKAGELPQLTKEDIERIRNIPEEAIDYSDIPPLTEDFWKNGVRGLMYRPVKKQITARIDADVLEWLKSGGKGYQTRINAILRQEMQRSLRD